MVLMEAVGMFLIASPFFRDDTQLRALRFLDHMLVIMSFPIELRMLW